MRKRRLPLFFGIYIAISAFLIWELVTGLALSGVAAFAVASGVALLASTIPVSSLLGHRGPRRLRHVLYVTSGLSVVWLFWGITATILLDAVRLVSSFTGNWADAISSYHLTVGILLSMAVATLYGLWRAWAVPQGTPIDVAVPGLPDHLEGLTIAHLTDLHVGPVHGIRRTRRLVRATNALAADIVVLTGDVADGDRGEFLRNALPLRNLRASLGVYACNGNHDHYAGVSTVMEELSRGGIRTLVNEWTEVAPGLVIAGIEDPAHAAKHPMEQDLDETLADVPKNATIVLLAHQPNVFDLAARHGVDLTLSGHTHAGQVMPWHFIVRRFYPHFAGHYQTGGSHLYVSAGVGTWGPPMRLGARPELPVYTLRKAPVGVPRIAVPHGAQTSDPAEAVRGPSMRGEEY